MSNQQPHGGVEAQEGQMGAAAAAPLAQHGASEVASSDHVEGKKGSVSASAVAAAYLSGAGAPGSGAGVPVVGKTAQEQDDPSVEAASGDSDSTVEEPITYEPIEDSVTAASILGNAVEPFYNEPLNTLVPAQVAMILDDQLDMQRRALADFKNLNRRRQDEVAKARDRGAASFAGELLDMLDNFDLAMKAVNESEDVQLAKGVQMVYNQLHSALQTAGMKQVPGVGSDFDPQVHEAITNEEDGKDRDEPEVIEVLRTGWQYKDQLLRAAVVRVVS